jgi:hypothetical protein
MSVIYYNDIFAYFAYRYSPYVFYSDDYEIIPNDCDKIGITFWDGDFAKHIRLVDMLLPKTKQLLIFVPEPVSTVEFIDFINSVKLDSRIKIFGNAILNFDMSVNYTTVPNWFIDFENYYVTKNWAKKILSQLDFTQPKFKMFECLLGREKKHRNFIANKYSESKYCSDIIFTYFKDNISAGAWHFDLQNKSNTADEILIDGESGRVSAVLPVDIYNSSYYSIVAETTVSNDYSHFTEKTAKPIVAKRLFIMFAGQHFLRNLRKLGFQTFGNVVDESYDEIADDNQRFTAAWIQVERLCQLDPQVVLTQIESTIQHNYQHFLTTDWFQPIKDNVRDECT